MKMSRRSSTEDSRQHRLLSPFVTLACCFSVASALGAPMSSSFQYVSPVPGSSIVALENNIILREGRPIDRGSLDAAALRVVGSLSGVHHGTLVLSDDGKTLVFKPDAPYAPKEVVSVRLEPGLKAADAAALPPLAFKFTTTPLSQERYNALVESRGVDECFVSRGQRPVTSEPDHAAAPKTPGTNALPGDYPALTLLTANNPAPGDVFLTPVNFQNPRGRLAILDNAGMPLFYRSGPTWTFDLKPQNGFLTYLVYFKGYAIDSTYAVVDSFETGNGYKTDVHDFQWLPNRHALLLAYDPEPVRMDLVVQGGNPNAIVTGLIVQELDAAKNVVFQWRSWDHFSILDASVSQLFTLTDSLIDYVHGNAVELDDDGNLLISSRHMNEITKIDRTTGAILWRMGLHAANNQFTFVNDARGFSHQHDIRRLPNGNVTLFDNGNFLSPPYSRGLEYKLNEQSHRATLVWQYVNNPLLFGPFMGNVQRLPSGGSMIGWGGVPSGPGITELHSDATKAYEIGFPAHMFTYRSYRFPWRGDALITSVEALDFGRVVAGGQVTQQLSVRNNTPAPITVTDLVTTDAVFSSPTAVPFTLAAGQSQYLTVAFAPPASGQFAANFYVQSVGATQLIAQVVALTGWSDVSTATAGDGPLATRLFAPATLQSGPVEVRFAIGEAHAPVRLEVFDARGTLVRLLDESVRDAGRYTLNWDRRDDRGRTVSRGIYFVRLMTGDYRESKKLALVR